MSQEGVVTADGITACSAFVVSRVRFGEVESRKVMESRIGITLYNEMVLCGWNCIALFPGVEITTLFN
jgi:hypothetical protein